MRLAPLATCLLALAAAARAGAAPVAPAPRFDLAVRLTVPPASLAAVHRGSSFPGAPLHAGRGVAVGVQARDAYAVAAPRLFPVEPGAEAELVVEVLGADVVLGDDDGWYARVEHGVVLRQASGGEVGRWRVRGEHRIVGPGEGSVAGAFAWAAAHAAAALEAAVAADPAASAWLSARAVAGRAAPRALRAARRRGTATTPASVPIAPHRGRLAYADLGLGAMEAGGVVLVGPSLRAGVAGEWWSAQLTGDYRGRGLAGLASGDGALDVLAAGVDAAVHRRLGSRLELEAGLGPRITCVGPSLRGAALPVPVDPRGPSGEAVVLGASAFAAVRGMGVLPRLGLRYRLGVELRERLGGEVALGGAARALAGAGRSATLLVGVELGRRLTSPASP